jgi:precorrin-2 dehydrogenase/sirohydrochlorin ferrochelatase
MIDGSRLRALVVGGGPVGERKANALLASGAQVRVVAPAVTAGLAESERRHAAQRGKPGLTIVRREYESGDIADAMIVVAATASPEINARVAADAEELHRLVNVVDGSSRGNCATAATHRSGDLLIAVSTGRAPGVAARIRDDLATRFDARYDEAIQAITALRSQLLADGRGAEWRRAAEELLDGNFCADVESGAFASRVGEWR